MIRFHCDNAFAWLIACWLAVYIWLFWLPEPVLTRLRDVIKFECCWFRQSEKLSKPIVVHWSSIVWTAWTKSFDYLFLSVDLIDTIDFFRMMSFDTNRIVLFLHIVHFRRHQVQYQLCLCYFEWVLSKGKRKSEIWETFSVDSCEMCEVT